MSAQASHHSSPLPPAGGSGRWATFGFMAAHPCVFRADKRGASAMNAFFYWSGLVAWIAFGIIGIFWTIDQSLEWWLTTFNFKREFLHWLAEKLKTHASH
jgi:hypothetical protein